MTNQSNQNEAAIADLLQSDEQQLYAQLAVRTRAMTQNPSVAGSFAPDITTDVTQMGLGEDLVQAGKRLFNRTVVQAYVLVCGHDPDDEAERKNVRDAFGLGDVAITTALAGLFTAQLGLAPAVAGVVAALILKRFAPMAYNELCQVWEKNLPAEGDHS